MKYFLELYPTPLTDTAGSSNNLLNQPHSVAYDWSSSILYVAEYANHRVMKYLSGSSIGTVVAGGNGQGNSNTQLNNPVGMYLDVSSNSLFIANFGGHNVVRWVLGASTWTLVAGVGGSPGSTSTLLNSPGDVTLDSYGNVYVVDTYNHRVQFFRVGESNGTTIAGVTLSPGSSSTQLNLPFGLAVDNNFNVYVADYGNHRVQQFFHY